MVTARERGLFQLLVSIQIIAILLLYIFCMVAVLVVYNREELPVIPLQAYLKYAVVALIAMNLEASSRPSALRPTLGRMRWTAGAVSRRQWVWILVSMTVLLVFSRDLRISRTFLGVFAASSLLVLQISNRYLLRALAALGLRHMKHWRLRTLIMGPKEWCDSVMPQVNSLHSLVEVKNVEWTDREGLTDADYLSMVSREPIDLLVMPARHLPDPIVVDLLKQGDKLGYRCWMPIELSRRYGRRFDLQKVGCLDVLTPPVEPLANTSNQLVKRTFDLIFSLILVFTVLPPLCIAVWIIHRLYSPGPLFFKQDRVGQNGLKFKVFKFRTLNVANGDETQQVTKGDSRIFKGGGLLRRLSIDEIPQFINVVLGDMSVVGPRPHMEEHDFRFREIFERYGVRRYVKPGVTGLAQVKGFRGEVNRPQDLRHRARLDNFYVTHWEIGLDLRIVVMTVVTMFIPPKTAY